MTFLLVMVLTFSGEPRPATSTLLVVLDPLVVMATIIASLIPVTHAAQMALYQAVGTISALHVCSFDTYLPLCKANIVFLDRRGKYDSDSESESPSPPPRNRRKSLGEQALAAVGLGGAAAALTGRDKDRDRSRSRARSRSRRGYDSRSVSRDRSEDGKKKFQQAAKAAITAGAIEAWRTRKEPGGFAGNGKRVLTAAIGAAGINGAMDREPDKHKTRHTIEAALGGLAGNRLINGPRDSSRSQSRGRGRSGEKESNIGGIASAAGLAALAGKAFNDYRSKSKNRRNSFESDSRSQSPRRKRSKSVTDYLRSGVDTGLAKLGLGDSENHHPKYGKDKFGRRHYDDDDDDYNSRPRGGGGEDEKGHGSGTDSYDSDEETKKQKKMRGQEFLTAGLATVATIHAAHSVHGSVQARKKNRKEVMEGKMSPEEARKKKSKALLQEAAAVGIATLGIKGAYSEWKEVNEKRKECREAKVRLEEKREHRRAKLQRQQSNRNSEPNLGARYQYEDDRGRYDDRSRYDDRGPRYYDDNPYSSGNGLPPPPIGSARF